MSNLAVSRPSGQFGSALAGVPLAVICLSFIFSAYGCGGGSGSSNPAATLQVTPTTVTVNGNLGYSAPTAQISADIQSSSSQQFYLKGSYTTHGLASVNQVVQNGTETLTLTFQDPSTLGVGTYSDTVTVEGCYDQACTQQVTGSPQTVSVTYTVTAPTPVVTALSPTSADAGGAAFVLTVQGSQFTAPSQVLWNGTALTTTYLSAYTLTAQVPAQDIAAAGSANVQVATDGVDSNTLPFTISPIGALALNSISPQHVTVGGVSFVLTALGGGFTVNSVVTLNGSNLATTYVNSTLLTAQVTAAQIATAGTVAIVVANSAGAGGTSSSLPLVVGPASKDAVSFQIDAAHTGAINFNSVSLPAASAWSVNVGGQPSYAIIAGGKVFVTVTTSGSNSELIALDGATGATLWGPIALAGGSNATYDNGALFVLSSVFGGSGLMQAFDPATGNALWSTALTGQYEFNAPPVAAQGIVATQGAGSGSTIYALNESNGAMAWTRGTDAGGFGTVAMSVDGLYESQPCQTYDFALATGLPVWFQNTGCDGGGGATPVVANGAVYSPIGSVYDGTLYAAETGTVLGTFAADVAPAVTATTAYMLQSKTLRSIAVSNNQVNWSFAGDGALVTSPIVVNNYVFVGSSNGNLYAVDATTGAQLWTQKFSAAIPGSPAYAAFLPYTGLAAGDGLLVVPNGTSVTAFLLSASP